MASILGFFSVSPACAGMIPDKGAARPFLQSEPRMRGDDPIKQVVFRVRDT